MTVSNRRYADQPFKSIGAKLVPFFKTVAIYFLLFIPVDRPSHFASLIKCLPIISLIGFVLLHQLSLSHSCSSSWRILLGLIFSCIADAFLIWPDYFVHGMAVFALAHIFYAAAFGFSPLNLYTGVVLYALSALVSLLLLPGLDGILTIGVPIYSFILVTMTWRAVAQVQFNEDLWTWAKVCSCIGGVLFMISDLLIGIHYFYRPIPFSQVLIMSTYYVAQLGIALSVVDSRADAPALLESSKHD
ncbi:unnamed protein product [Bemisia tabaci]|uniref:lysoplasmalogenase n=1 Tax=Bemisia tabaci TaxID=7038 RepID=A0A9P0F7W2_BEMTA|nr:PREDICTED: lysoplasmalogenase-like protein TMEM86A [Bemisia tabaci]CAH0395737.1 unnamed protein product [Bemisia tabaci]